MFGASGNIKICCCRRFSVEVGNGIEHCEYQILLVVIKTGTDRGLVIITAIIIIVMANSHSGDPPH
jgi:hypothetical protein